MKSWLQSASLATRLTLLVLLLTSLTWAVFSAVLLYETHDEVSELLDKQLYVYTDLLWQSLGDDDDIHFVSHDKPDHLPHVAFSLYNRQGKLLVSSSEYVLPFQNTPKRKTRTIILDDKHWEIAIRQSQDRQLVVGEPHEKRDKLIDEIVSYTGMTALFALAVLLPLLFFAIRHGLMPLKVVDAELARRAPDNLQPLDLPVPAEIAPLRDRLNTLFAQVNDTLEKERRFTADAAHELRTPLAGLRVQIELAQSSPRPATREKALTQALLGVDRSTHLVAQLLELARLDYATVKTGLSIDMAQLARQALQDAGLPQTCLHTGNVWTWHGHAGLLALLLRNLLDNAKRYAGENAAITIKINQNAISISDNGPGVPPEVLARLGERFYRPPGQSQTGAGLGLSIVHRIAELHQASITLASDQGFEVTIRQEK
ncbi:ATP-binding protein [Iodobacter sp. LRB]|uniref:ATP-binding protein n=1 Tax=unclassified Iodobacter TaxID=235634 RepID=UPI000C0FB727|nr:ATP-binding protein [Iodobacter sp. BJB302]PHU99726.1 two-component system sensor histidine kinase QseC [Iodobacter sp. BJB302]